MNGRRTPDHAQLTRYLLGELPEEERLQIEEDCVNNDDLFEQLEAVEAELTDDYVRGTLRGRRRKEFEERLLRSSGNAEQRELAKILMGGKAVPGRVSFVARFRLSLTVSATVAFALLVGWFSITRWFPRPRAASPAQITASNKPPTQPPVPAAESAPNASSARAGTATAPPALISRKQRAAVAPPKQPEPPIRIATAPKPAVPMVGAPPPPPAAQRAMPADQPAILIAGNVNAAATSSSTLTGTVTDPTGAVIPNADVSLTDATSHATSHTRSDPAGQFTFARLQAGTYQLSAAAPGFQSTLLPTTLLPNQSLAQNLTLTVGRSSQTVEVTAAAPFVQNSNAQSDTLKANQLTPVPASAASNFALFSARSATNNNHPGTDGLTPALKLALGLNSPQSARTPIPAAWLLFFGFNPLDPTLASAPDPAATGHTLLYDFQNSLNPRDPNRTAPAIASLNPPNGATNVPITTQIVIRFNQPLLTGGTTTTTRSAAERAILTALETAPHPKLFNRATDLPAAATTLQAYLNRLPCCANSVVPTHITLSSGQIIPTTLTVSQDSRTITITPLASLSYKTLYTIILTNLRSSDGFPMPFPTQITFTTTPAPAAP